MKDAAVGRTRNVGIGKHALYFTFRTFVITFVVTFERSLVRLCRAIDRTLFPIGSRNVEQHKFVSLVIHNFKVFSFHEVTVDRGRVVYVIPEVYPVFFNLSIG